MSLKPDEFPLPPDDLMERIGPGGGDARETYLRTGQESRLLIESHLGEEWDWAGKRSLDFGCGSGRIIRQFADVAHLGDFFGCDIDQPSIEWLQSELEPPFSFITCGKSPPLDYDAQSFDLIYAFSVYTHLTDEWAAWMLEHHRLLKPDGHLLVTFLGPGMMEPLIGEPWDEERIGMNSLFHGHPWSLGGPISFNSLWWIRAHWGRAFEIVSLNPELPADSWVQHGVALMRKREVDLTEGDLIAPEADEPREFAALLHQAAQLARESERLRDEERGLRDELIQAHSTLKRETRRADKAESELHALLGSRSWRLSEPIRQAANRLRQRR